MMPGSPIYGSLATLRWAVFLLGGFSLQTAPATAQDFLRTFNATRFHNNLEDVFDTTLRCGAEALLDETGAVTRTLLPMWRALPKSPQGRVPWRMVRYLAHRYFMKKSSLMIRGFEPSLSLRRPGQGVPGILDERSPIHLKALLMSKHATSYGFGLDDVARLVLVLERLVFESQSGLLADVYRKQDFFQDGAISQEELSTLLEEYMVHWMMSGDSKGIKVLTEQPELRADTFPNWNETVGFAAGQIRAVGYARMRAAEAGRHGQRALRASEFTFEDVHEVVGSITTSFASYWEPQCASMKKVLYGLDPHRTGRVPLASFYSAALSSEWHFTESEAYLRELGALDETSEWRGSQVIIPNYVQAAPNCIITTQHYWLCCANECEGLFGEIEKTIGAPTATPEDILQAVGNMTAQEALDDDAVPSLGRELTEQLRNVAALHGGEVPLHGRLFAQWLHYVFPRQCPFPHKAGAAAVVSPGEFGSRSVATREEMLRLQASPAVRLASSSSSREELQWMSQWSLEEELLTDASFELRAPWKDGAYVAAGGAAILLAAMLGAVRISAKLPEEEAREAWLMKMHMV